MSSKNRIRDLGFLDKYIDDNTELDNNSEPEERTWLGYGAHAADDVGKSAWTGIRQGALSVWPRATGKDGDGEFAVPSAVGDAEWLFRYGYSLFNSDQDYEDIDTTIDTTSERSQDFFDPHVPETFAGELAQGVGASAPFLALGPAVGLARGTVKGVAPAVWKAFGDAARYVAAPQIAGEAVVQGAGLEDSQFEPAARIMTGIGVSGFGPAAVKRALKPTGKRPLSEAVKVLEKHDIPVSAGARTGQKVIGLAESETGAILGGPGPKVQRASALAYTREIAKNADIDFDVVKGVTKEAIAKKKNWFSRVFENTLDDLVTERKAKGIPDLPLLKSPGIDKALAGMRQIIDDVKYDNKPFAKQLGKLVDTYERAVKSGEFTPTRAQTFRADLGRKIRGSKHNGKTFGKMQDLLDDMADPFFDGSTLKGIRDKARRDYREFKPIQKAMKRSKEGLVSPKQMRNELAKQEGDNYYQAGLTRKSVELTDAAADVLGDYANSETAARQDVRSFLNAPSDLARTARSAGGAAGGGAAIGFGFGGPAGAAAGFVAAPVVAAAGARGLHSNAVQTWLKGTGRAGRFADKFPQTGITGLGKSVLFPASQEPLRPSATMSVDEKNRLALAEYLKALEEDKK